MSSATLKVEDVKKETKNETKEEVQLSETEKEAMKHGWRPQEEFDGHPNDFVSAREFINRKSLFDRISRDRSKIDKLEKAVEALVKHNEKVFESGYESAMADLKAERTKALQEGDAETVNMVEKRIEQLETRKEEGRVLREEIDKNVPPPVDPAWDIWLEQNRWYNSNPEMHGAADGIAKAIYSEAQSFGKTVNYAEMLNEVSRKIRIRFPEAFGNQTVTRQTTKDDKGDASKKEGSLTKSLREIESNLDEGEVEIMNTILSSTGMTKEKYLQDLEKVSKRR